jgi:Uncharacterized protein conserved in bacteria
MQKIIPHLWFDHQAEQAAEFYCSTFDGSGITDKAYYGKAGSEISGMPQGSLLTVDFHLFGYEFIALNGGPVFHFTPAISFFINCDNREELDRYWSRLSDGGYVLMELGTYPFSERFGWVMDRFGLTWQLNLESGKQKIAPYLLFVGEQNGKAEAAINYYCSLFEGSGLHVADRYREGEEGQEGTMRHAEFAIAGQEFIAMDGGLGHPFQFNEAISFFVNCETQEEVDFLWDKLSKLGEEVECGWLKDQFGVSWQIVPAELHRLVKDSDPVRRERVMEAMFRMKKLDIRLLEDAYNG